MRISRDPETIIKNQTEILRLKNKIAEMKYSLRLNIKFELTDKRISKFEDRLIEIIQPKE